jgi:hypothetical protein
MDARAWIDISMFDPMSASAHFADSSRTSPKVRKVTQGDIARSCHRAQIMCVSRTICRFRKPHASSIKLGLPELADAFIDKNAHLVRHEPSLGIHDLHRRRLSLEFFQNVFELAALSVRRHHVREESCLRSEQLADDCHYGSATHCAARDLSA